ncbi:single-stranded DNA-binding protein [Fibrobacter sp.]|uniref:single-stranded DNA-binding protein n=1 Tax=Fibrobacter sp. TaxID=35828 RepID=UPI00388F6AD4
MSLNECSFCGRLGNNPEVTVLPSGKERVRFSIAVDRDYKTEDGKRPTDWIPVTIWGSANYVRKTNLSKGDCVIVNGRIEDNTWTDNNGVQHNTKSLNCSRIYLVSKKSDEKSAKDKAAEQAAANYDPNAEDDLPF